LKRRRNSGTFTQLPAHPGAAFTAKVKMITWAIQSRPGAGECLATRGPEMLRALLASPPDEQLATLQNCRALHHALFHDMAPTDLPEAAGTWRGTPDTALEHVARVVYVSRQAPGLRRRDPCAPAADVGMRMVRLAGSIGALWDRYTGLTEPDALRHLAGFLAEFFAIHPFLDGNGHVARILAVVLAQRLGLSCSPGWTIHPRPYSHMMSLCLQWHAAHPDLLQDHLGRWFRNP